jgi:hypothetical protein
MGPLPPDIITLVTFHQDEPEDYPGDQVRRRSMAG